MARKKTNPAIGVRVADSSAGDPSDRARRDFVAWTAGRAASNKIRIQSRDELDSRNDFADEVLVVG